MILSIDRNSIRNFKLKKILFLTLSVSILKELFVFVYSNSGRGDNSLDLVPNTFYWVWLMIPVILMFLLFKKYKIKFDVFLISFFSLITVVVIIWWFIPSSLKLEPNYYGVESRVSLDSHESGRYDEKIEFDYSLKTGFLYNKYDQELIKELEDARTYNDYVGTVEFLFWQSGLACGFIPFGIREYNGGIGFYKRVELYFTIGPVVLLEILIKALYYNFMIVFLIQFLWFVSKKEHIWWYNQNVL